MVKTTEAQHGMPQDPDQYLQQQPGYVCDAAGAERLTVLETKLDAGLKDFVTIGTCLQTIQQDRLYRATQQHTFEEYVEQRWGIKRRTAYQHIECAAIYANVCNCTQTPPRCEGQVRPLRALKDADQQRQAWQAAVAAAEQGVKPLTADLVAAQVQAVQAGAGNLAYCLRRWFPPELTFLGLGRRWMPLVRTAHATVELEPQAMPLPQQLAPPPDPNDSRRLVLVSPEIDLWAPEVSATDRDAVLAAMAAAPGWTFLVWSVDLAAIASASLPDHVLRGARVSTASAADSWHQFIVAHPGLFPWLWVDLTITDRITLPRSLWHVVIGTPTEPSAMPDREAVIRWRFALGAALLSPVLPHPTRWGAQLTTSSALTPDEHRTGCKAMPLMPDLSE